MRTTPYCTPRAVAARGLAIAAVAMAAGAAPAPRPARAQPDDPLRVLTSEGLLRGAVDGGSASWKNVPYAAPPLGALRWRAPQPPALRARERDAAAYGPACPQLPGGVLRPDVTPAWSEDCLQLNVWAPLDARLPRPLPILVWFHGGGLIQGSAVEPLYNGAALAAGQGVVVVTVNYRLGALGYLAHRAFVGADPAAPGAGNYGLLDQIAALDWLQANAAAFGGDPGRVTIFGESAGGVSVCALLASPLARGRFHAAVMQSGACRDALARLDGARPLPPALAQGDRFSAAAGCVDAADEAACLRALDAAAVLATLPGEIGILNPGAETYDLVVDGHALTEPPGAAVAAGRAAAVPFALGANADEGTLFAQPFKATLTAAGYEAAVRSLYRGDADAVLALYPASSYDAPYLALADVTGDVGFVCPARRVARAHAAAGRPTWLYHFAFVTALGRASGLGSHHGAEIPFLFGDPDGGAGAAAAGPDARALARTMQRFWANIARDGAPGAVAVDGAAGDPLGWARYDPAADIGLQFGAKPRATTGWRAAKCDLWDRLAFAGGAPPPASPTAAAATATPGGRPTATPDAAARGRAVLPVAFVP